MDSYEQNEVVRVQVAVNFISKDFNDFDTNKPCVLCVIPGHTFNSCHNFQNPKMKGEHICLCLVCNCFWKATDRIGASSANVLHLVWINAPESLTCVHQVDKQSTHSCSNDTLNEAVIVYIN